MTTTNHCEENKAIMLTTADADLERAGEMLRQGNLVASTIQEGVMRQR